MPKDDMCETVGPVIDFSDMADAVGYALRRAQLYVYQDFIETFSAEGIRPPDFAVLMVLSRNPGLKQSEVAEALGIQRANFVAIIDGLEGRKLVERRKSETDRRVQCLFITNAGLAYLDTLKPIWQSHEDRVVARLGGPESRDHLVNLLGRLYD